MTSADYLGGLVIVDKPAGCTSHDVVARMRRVAGTRKVGHAGTLDPMATGVLVLGVGRATRLLGHLQLADKEYDATIRLGESTVTDDAEGEVVATTDASHLTWIRFALPCRHSDGAIRQVPTFDVGDQGRRQAVVRPRPRRGGRRARPARPVTVSVFEARVRTSAARSRTSMSTSLARPAPTSARWRAISALRSASAAI